MLNFVCHRLFYPNADLRAIEILEPQGFPQVQIGGVDSQQFHFILQVFDMWEVKMINIIINMTIVFNLHLFSVYKDLC